MKLSEILGWDDKRSENQEMVGVSNAALNSVVNAALASCDREIDREALAIILFDEHHNGNWEGHWEQEDYLERADHIISTMPTWLKRIKG